MEKIKLEEPLKDTLENISELWQTLRACGRGPKCGWRQFYSIQGFCKDSVEAADILEEATQCVPRRQPSPQEPPRGTGNDRGPGPVFTRQSLLRLDAVGATFNPYEFRPRVEGQEPGTWRW